MKKRLKRLADRLEDRFRACCGEITPGKRLAVILIILAAGTAANVYITFRAVYNLGAAGQRGRIPDTGHIAVPRPLKDTKDIHTARCDSVAGKGGGDENP